MDGQMDRWMDSHSVQYGDLVESRLSYVELYKHEGNLYQ